MSCITGSYTQCVELHEKVDNILSLSSRVDRETVANNISLNEDEDCYIFDDSSLIGDYDTLFGEGFKEQYNPFGQEILLKLMMNHTNMFRAHIFKKIYDKWMNLFNELPNKFKLDCILDVVTPCYIGKPVTIDELEYITPILDKDIFHNVFEIFDPVLVEQINVNPFNDNVIKRTYRCYIPLTVLDAVSTDTNESTGDSASVSIYQMLLGNQAYKIIQNIIEANLIKDKRATIGTTYRYMYDTFIMKYHDNKSLYFEKV